MKTLSSKKISAAKICLWRMSLSSLICGGSIVTNFNNLNNVTQNSFIDWQKPFKGDS